MPITAILLTAVLSLLSQPLQSGANDTQASFSLSISVHKTTVEVGSEVIVHAILQNHSSNEVRYGVFLGESQIDTQLGIFGISVHDQTGARLLTLAERKKRESAHASGKPTPGPSGSVFSSGIQPGKSISADIPLSNCYDLSEPGEYTIQAQRFDPFTQEWVKSNEIKIKVTPIKHRRARVEGHPN